MISDDKKSMICSLDTTATDKAEDWQIKAEKRKELDGSDKIYDGKEGGLKDWVENQYYVLKQWYAL